MEYIDNEKLARDIKHYMEDKGYSQRDTAVKMGVSAQQLNNMLKRKSLDFKDVARILNAIGCKLDYTFVDASQDK